MPSGGQNKRPLAVRFWEKVSIGTDSECWEWKASLTKQGYGMIEYGGSTCRSNRVAYELEIGPIVDGLHVLHTCDNPLCCNPGHLYLGTHEQNMKDKMDRNRVHRPLGEKNPKARLKEYDVRLIREFLKSGFKVSEIANEFEVKWNAIWRIKKGIYWNVTR